MFTFRALASGSSGNAYLLTTARANLLVEAGLRVSTLRKHLANEGLSADRLTAVLISHEHRDHCAGAVELLDGHGIPILANAAVLRALGVHDRREVEVLPAEQPVMVGDVEVLTFPVSHDAAQPVGFLLRVEGRTIALATDLGEATPPVAEAVRAADLVVLEANHDREMLANGRYPYHLRRRVAGPTGHLSNVQCAEILAGQLQQETSEVWLAHLSKANNTPALALRTVRSWLRQRGVTVPVDVLARDRPSLRWHGQARPRQLSLLAELPA